MKRIAGLWLGVSMMAAAGCTRWQHTHPIPAPAGGPGTFGAARVTSAEDGMMLVLRNVEVTADSVIGWHGETPRRRRRVALHRDQMLVFERRAFDPWETAGASVLAVLVAYGAAVAYFLSNVKV